MSTCPTCNGTGLHHDTYCPDCLGIGHPIGEPLPPIPTPTETFMDRARQLREAGVDAMVDPGRELSPDEWDTLVWFVGDAEAMWEASEQRLRMLRTLADRSVRWLADLYALREAVREHRDETRDFSVYWPADVRLWALVDEDDGSERDG